MSMQPTTVLVFGILNILFGVFGMLRVSVIASFLVDFMSRAMVHPAFDQVHASETYAIYAATSVVIRFVAAFLLVAAGIGLLRMNSWGRTLSIGYGVFDIVNSFLDALLNHYLFIQPLLEYSNSQGPGPAQSVLAISKYSGCLSVTIGLIYPVLLIYFMSEPKVKAALSAATVQDPPNRSDPPETIVPPAGADGLDDTPPVE